MAQQLPRIFPWHFFISFSLMENVLNNCLRAKKAFVEWQNLFKNKN